MFCWTSSIPLHSFITDLTIVQICVHFITHTLTSSRAIEHELLSQTLLDPHPELQTHYTPAWCNPTMNTRGSIAPCSNSLCPPITPELRLRHSSSSLLFFMSPSNLLKALVCAPAFRISGPSVWDTAHDGSHDDGGTWGAGNGSLTRTLDGQRCSARTCPLGVVTFNPPNVHKDIKARSEVLGGV